MNTSFEKSKRISNVEGFLGYKSPNFERELKNTIISIKNNPITCRPEYNIRDANRSKQTKSSKRNIPKMEGK